MSLASIGDEIFQNFYFTRFLHYLAIYRCQRHNLTTIRRASMWRIQRGIACFSTITGWRVIYVFIFFLSFETFKTPKLILNRNINRKWKHKRKIKFFINFCNFALLFLHQLIKITFLYNVCIKIKISKF